MFAVIWAEFSRRPRGGSPDQYDSRDSRYSQGRSGGGSQNSRLKHLQSQLTSVFFFLTIWRWGSSQKFPVKCTSFTNSDESFVDMTSLLSLTDV